jgi:O-acetyl-ADP-ribose deacetylase (regulator of RNase III)
MIAYLKGDLLESNVDYICHQVNCRGRMGSGIALRIRKKFPEVYRVYSERYEDALRVLRSPEQMLGSADIVQIPGTNQHVVNMYSQRSYGYDGKCYTSYKAFKFILQELKKDIPTDCTIGFPKGIGCGLGGGKWTIISKLIEDILGDSHEVYIYELER